MSKLRFARARAGYDSILAGVCLGLVGCTAILGDFTSSGGLAPSSDAGNEADATADATEPAEGAPLGDAPTDALTDSGSDAAADAADAAAGPMACTTWLYAQPLTLEVLSTGNRSVTGPLTVIALANGRARVIAGKAGGGVPFSVYTIDASQTPAQVIQLDAPTAPNVGFAYAHRSGSAISPYTALTYFTKQPSLYGSVAGIVLPDAMAANGPLPSSFTVYQETAQFPSVFGIHVLPFSTTDLFTAISYPTQTAPTNYVFGVGRATTAVAATLSTVDTTPNANDVKNPILFHANGNVYIYDENDSSTPGLSTWTVPDTAAFDAGANLPKRAIAGGTPAFLHDMVVNSALPAANVSFQSVAPGGSPVSYRAGTVDYANLDKWVSTDLVAVKTYPDATIAPVFPSGSGQDSRWSGDNIMLLGPGLRAADGGGSPGLNMLWFDATGAIRSEEDGASALLTDRGNFTVSAAAAIQIGATSAKWAVTWVETKTDDAGSYDTLLYDELDCQ
jgi:hypothetical protein